jgi:Holliday junction resolvase-like predicted endonuclease
MTQAKDAVGAYGERVALAHLVEQGMVVLDRNWRCRTGEIDLILRDGSDLVFCEVKTRRGNRFGTPAEAVCGRQQSASTSSACSPSAAGQPASSTYAGRSRWGTRRSIPSRCSA